MAADYNALVRLVRDWSNRDEEALPNSIIQGGLRYAADTAYRELMIPPLEHSTFYIVRGSGDDPWDLTGISNYQETQVTTNSVSGSRGLTQIELPIPGDTVSFIHLRVKGSASPTGMTNTAGSRTLNLTNGSPTVLENRLAVVFNEKMDTRTFYDIQANTYAENFWTRQGNNILVQGRVSDGDIIELFYYRRLPALNARYNITASSPVPQQANTYTTIDNSTPQPVPANVGSIDIDGTQVNVVNVGTVDNPLWKIGAEIPNWLRDENEKVVLFGALYHCFDYLNEPENAQKFMARMMDEIQKLNDEEHDRRSSGGNVQTHYISHII